MKVTLHLCLNEMLNPDVINLYLKFLKDLEMIIENGLCLNNEDAYNYKKSAEIAHKDKVKESNLSVKSIHGDNRIPNSIIDAKFNGLSKKIKDMKHIQALDGERVNGSYPYGYLVDSNDKNMLIIDPETAPIVKKVFYLFLQNMGVSEILEWLNINKVLTPSALKYVRTQKSCYKKHMTSPYTWSDKTIRDMINRREYIGHTITSKSSLSNKLSLREKNLPENQFLFLNTHEAIISEEMWRLAQKRIQDRVKPSNSKGKDIFEQLLYCSNCGQNMSIVRKKSKKISYKCINCQNEDDLICSTHYISKTTLERCVLEKLQHAIRYASLYCESNTLATDIESEINVSKFHNLVKKNKEIQLLTYGNVREFIDKIIIYNASEQNSTKKIDIFFKFIGKLA